jgi:hypothetical protein
MEIRTGSNPMIAAIAAIKYLGQITDRFFEAQMQRAAIKIRVRSQRFPH